MLFFWGILLYFFAFWPLFYKSAPDLFQDRAMLLVLSPLYFINIMWARTVCAQLQSLQLWNKGAAPQAGFFFFLIPIMIWSQIGIKSLTINNLEDLTAETVSECCSSVSKSCPALLQPHGRSGLGPSSVQVSGRWAYYVLLTFSPDLKNWAWYSSLVVCLVEGSH